jgi:hypothetical protein
MALTETALIIIALLWFVVRHGSGDAHYASAIVPFLAQRLQTLI